MYLKCKCTLFLLLVGLVNIVSMAGALELKVDRKTSGKVAPGEVIIEIKKGVIDLGREKGVVAVEKVSISSKSLSALNKRYGLLSVERLFSGTQKDEPSDIYLFRFSPRVNIKRLVSAYKDDKDVIYVEPNYIVHIQ